MTLLWPNPLPLPLEPAALGQDAHVGSDLGPPAKHAGGGAPSHRCCSRVFSWARLDSKLDYNEITKNNAKYHLI